jgi:hypothetical protein
LSWSRTSCCAAPRGDGRWSACSSCSAWTAATQQGRSSGGEQRSAVARAGHRSARHPARRPSQGLAPLVVAEPAAIARLRDRREPVAGEGICASPTLADGLCHGQGQMVYHAPLDASVPNGRRSRPGTDAVMVDIVMAAGTGTRAGRNGMSGDSTGDLPWSGVNSRQGALVTGGSRGVGRAAVWSWRRGKYAVLIAVATRRRRPDADPCARPAPRSQPIR